MSPLSRWESYPFPRVQVQIFDLPVLEETRQTDAVIRKVGFVADDHDVVLTNSCVQFQYFLSKRKVSIDSVQGKAVVATSISLT